MTTTSATEIPSTGDLVDHHRDMSERHARMATRYLEQLENAAPGTRRDNLLNQQIGVHLKLADVQARLALAVANSVPRSPAGLTFAEVPSGAVS